MNKRWYDMNPTLSMAISLLQNATPQHRDQTVNYIGDIVRNLYPTAYEKVFAHRGGLFDWRQYIQKRQTMDERSWLIIETLRHLPETDKENLAVEVIRYIYCLENENMPDFTFQALTAAI